ncbi:hypothetical protein GOBAR_DD05197 [Gossypium barbadense]|nr:hypothetical protein GOBAR_DD05197 [Gossypium barbadense]
MDMEDELANLKLADEEDDLVLRKGEDPIQVPLFNTNFWVQIHNLPLGCMSEGMTRQLGNFVGDFMDYVATIVTRGIKKFIKIQVSLDVRNPLRRRK